MSATDLGIEVCGVEIDVVNALTLDRGMQHMLRTRAEVATMQVSEDLCGADEGRLVRTVAGVDGLFAFKQEQTRTRT